MNRKTVHITVVIILLSVCGIAAVFSATATTESLSFVRNQTIAYAAGFAIYIMMSEMNPHTFRKSSVAVFISSAVLLSAVLVVGTGYEQTGSKSWISVGSFSLQPSELAKPAFVISFASHITSRFRTVSKLKSLIPLILHAGIIVLLLCLQPDFGTAFVFIFTAIIMLFCAGIQKRYFISGAVAGVAALPLLWTCLKEYQKNRVLVFLNPDLDPTGAGYNVIQSKTALASGGLLGQGYMKGMLTQADMLPAKHTDFIFSVIGEEWGFIGCAVILILLYLLIIFCLKTALRAANPFERLVCIGLGSVILCHTVINTGMCTGFVPVTGIPLPFISYGGSFVISNMASAGILASIQSHLPLYCREYNRRRRNKPYSK